MAKVKRFIKTLLLFGLILLTLWVGIISTPIKSTSVSAASTSKAMYEQTNVLDDLRNSTIDDEEFDLKRFSFDEKKELQVLSFVEYCYSFFSAKTSNYGLYVYLYNPKGLDIDTLSPLNQIQFSIGLNNNISYRKYKLAYLNQSEEPNYEGLFYKFRVNLTETERVSILDGLNSTERVYRISGIEIVETGNMNAKEYLVSTTYKYSGYAAGYGNNADAPSTLSCNCERLDVLSLDVYPTQYRPAGTNGKNEYTQDSLHSVYFAVPNKYIETYGAMSAVHATWLNAVLAPGLVTGNADVYNSIKDHLGEHIYGGDYWYWSNYNKNNSIPYEIIASRRMGSVPNTELSHPRWAFNTNETYHGSWTDPPTRYIYELYMLFYAGSGTDSADYYSPSSQMLAEVLEASKNLGGDLINGKYSTKLFDIYDQEFTEVNIKADETYQLTNAVIDKSWWDKLWGYSGSVSTSTFDNIQAIYPVKAEDFSGSVDEVCNRLYISKGDYTHFLDFYNNHKKDYTTYLFRYQTSEYISMEAATWKTDKSSFWEGGGLIDTYKPDRIDTNNYFFQQTINLDFDIIDVTFSSGEKDTVIPVVSDPIDVIPEPTPPVLTETDVPIDWWTILKIILIVVILAVLVYFLWPVLQVIIPAIFKAIVWLLKMLFKGIRKLFELIGSLFKKRKKKKENKKEEKKKKNGKNG